MDRTTMNAAPHFAPINGISLERYAELGAAIADEPNDLEAQVRIVEGLGVTRADWEAAKNGWTARMQDMALMGQVATAFMPMYQAALAKKKGVIEASFEDFIAMAGAAKAYGYERMLATYGIDGATWTQISGSWTTKMGQNPMQYMNYGPAVEQEAMRIQQGGQHRPVSIKSTSGAAQAGTGAVQNAPAPANAQQAAQQYENQMMAQAVQANVANHMQMASNQAANAYAGVAQNVGFMGGAMLGAMGMGAIANGVGPGMNVLVTWPDGNKYPGRVVQVANGQVCVGFQNGQQQWVPEHAVARA